MLAVIQELFVAITQHADADTSFSDKVTLLVCSYLPTLVFSYLPSTYLPKNYLGTYKKNYLLS